MATEVKMMTRIAINLIHIPKNVLLLLLLMLMLMRQEHPVMGVMMMRRSWHLKLFFSLDQDVGQFGRTVRFNERFFWQ